MGLFEDVVVNAKEAVNAVGKKAGQMVDISKLRLSAADLNNEISKRFEALGRVIYDAKKTGNDSADLADEGITTIDDLYEQMDALCMERLGRITVADLEKRLKNRGRTA